MPNISAAQTIRSAAERAGITLPVPHVAAVIVDHQPGVMIAGVTHSSLRGADLTQVRGLAEAGKVTELAGLLVVDEKARLAASIALSGYEAGKT